MEHFNDQSNENFDVGNEIIYNTEILKFNLCGYSDSYILVKVDITIAARDESRSIKKLCNIYWVYDKDWSYNNRLYLRIKHG